jgi:type II secretory pathway component PulM
VNPRKRLILLISIIVIITVVVEVIAVWMLYQAAITQQRARLEETVKSQARLIEAVARFDREHSGTFPRDARNAALSQVIDAHRHYSGFGETGEFTLARRNGDHIDYLLSHRHFDLEDLKPLPLGSPWGQPMQAALDGRSGTMIGVDYRGAEVLAAFEPVAELELGIVAKIDMKEVRRPFISAMMISSMIAAIAIVIGVWLFFSLTNPLIDNLERTNAELQSSLVSVKMLSGMLPICASCKKIRDDKGYWSQIESYVSEHSEAEFSHGICPECARKLYPAYDLGKNE